MKGENELIDELKRAVPVLPDSQADAALSLLDYYAGRGYWTDKQQVFAAGLVKRAGEIMARDAKRASAIEIDPPAGTVPQPKPPKVKVAKVKPMPEVQAHPTPSFSQPTATVIAFPIAARTGVLNWAARQAAEANDRESTIKHFVEVCRFQSERAGLSAAIVDEFEAALRLRTKQFCGTFGRDSTA